MTASNNLNIERYYEYDLLAQKDWQLSPRLLSINQSV